MTSERAHPPEPGRSVLLRREAVGYALLEQAASYDESTADWRTRMIGRSIGPAADRAIKRGHAIISAAARIIYRSGGDDFTMRKVADEAGLSLRALYQHFSGKDDLLVALLEESQVVFARLIERHAARYADPLDKLGAALYFATDPRQHTDHDYNAALTRYVMRASVTAAEQVGHARRPVMEALARLIHEAMLAGKLEPGDPELAACSVNLAYISYRFNTYLGNSTGAALPTSDKLMRFCLQGLGARLPAGWEERFRITDDEALKYRHESERAAGTEGQLAKPSPPA
jgi:AcrR family transcriptional regulator